MRTQAAVSTGFDVNIDTIPTTLAKAYAAMGNGSRTDATSDTGVDAIIVAARNTRRNLSRIPFEYLDSICTYQSFESMARVKQRIELARRRKLAVT